MPRNEVWYEWDMEEYDAEGVDILDHDFREKLSELGLPVNSNQKLVLVRYEGNDAEGETDRLWAYVKDNMLPKRFSNAFDRETMVEIPQRFHREIAREACRVNR